MRRYHHHHHHHIHSHQLPCFHCQPHGFIRMVQHLIERCMLFRMDREGCIRALAKHANIDPVITFTVWTELLKENRSFFEAYLHHISPTPYNFFAGRAKEINKVQYYYGREVA